MEPMEMIEGLINDLAEKERAYAAEWVRIYDINKGAKHIKYIEMLAKDTIEYQQYNQVKLAYDYVQAQGWDKTHTKQKNTRMVPQTEAD